MNFGFPPLSMWELLILVEKGRVVLNVDGEEWIGQALMAAHSRMHGSPRKLLLPPAKSACPTVTQPMRSSLPRPRI